jgi:hypothetical protein
MDRFIGDFAALLSGQKAFPVKTRRARLSTMFYEGERKAFLHYPIIRDTPLLTLNQQLLSYTRYRKSRKRRFDPHLTLFWGRLSREETAVLKNRVSTGAGGLEEDHEWICDNVSLYVEKGAEWRPYHIYEIH